MTTQEKIVTVYDGLKELSLYKNHMYGDSAIHPIGIFCKEPSDIQIRSRLDDKLSRVKNSPELRKNDVSDLIGYLMLLCISKDWTDFTDLMD